MKRNRGLGNNKTATNNVSFEKAESTQKLELPDFADKAGRFTVLVECWE